MRHEQKVPPFAFAFYFTLRTLSVNNFREWEFQADVRKPSTRIFKTLCARLVITAEGFTKRLLEVVYDRESLCSLIWNNVGEKFAWRVCIVSKSVLCDIFQSHVHWALTIGQQKEASLRAIFLITSESEVKEPYGTAVQSDGFNLAGRCCSPYVFLTN